MKFRILRGNHCEGKYPSGHPWQGRSIVYDIGEVVDSKTNLARFNSSGPLGPKFQRVYDNAPATDKVKLSLEIARRREAEAVYDDGNGPHGPTGSARPPSDGLDEMTLVELKKVAKEEEVTLPQNATKEEAVKAIRESQALMA
jgi:hypothetical protein